MTDTDVRVNGKPAGPLHQGGFYESRYDVSRLLRYGQCDLLDVVVAKQSANASINRSERSGPSSSPRHSSARKANPIW